MEFRKLSRREEIPAGYSLTTVAQAEANLQSIAKLCPPSESCVRLKNGLLRGTAVERTYDYGLEFKLISTPKSSEEEVLTEEDSLIALAYAAEYDDVDDEIGDLVRRAGQKILTSKLPFAYLGTILHVCVNWGSVDTLAKVLDKHSRSVDVTILDRDGETALHNLPNTYVLLSFEESKRAACLLLQNADYSSLLSVQSNFNGDTVLCKALTYRREEVCKAVLKAAQEKIHAEQSAKAAQEKIHAEQSAKAAQEKIHAEQSATPELPDWLALKNNYGYTALHLAVKREYVDIVNEILAYPGAKGLNLTSQQCNHGNTPLHFAAAHRNTEICSKLLQYSASMESKDGVNARNRDGQTALHIASISGHAEVCAKLLEYGASISLKDNAGRCALTNALHQGHRQITHTLLDACIPKEHPRSQSGSGRGRGLAPLTDAKVPDPAALTNAKFGFGLTPLHVAAAISSPPHIASLLKARAFVDARSDDGRTPLHIVTRKGNTQAFFQFLDTSEVKFSSERMNRKKWINMRDFSGQTALHNMVRLAGRKITRESKGVHDMVNALLSKGALVDLKDGNGETPLHVAARGCCGQTVSILLSNDGPYSSGTDKDKWIAMCDFSGETALHEAARKGRSNIVQKLLSATKNPNDVLRVRDIENRTALHWAVQNRDNTTIEEMMKLADDISKRFLLWNVIGTAPEVPPLLQKHVDEVKVQQSQQTSLLTVAANEEDLDMTRELINRGADVTTLEDDSRLWLSKNLCRKASDQPALEDSLGRRRLVEGVAALLLNPYTGTPITIGIFGDWGTGKSSFMFQVEEALLHMAVKETFKNAATQSHDQLLLGKQSFVLKFSSSGVALRAKVDKALYKRIPKTDIESEKIKEGDAIDNFPIKLQSEYRKLFKDLALTDRSKLVQSAKIDGANLAKRVHKALCGKFQQKNLDDQMPSHAKRMVRMTDQTLQDALVTGHTPAVLTVRYNAWQYDNKTEASAGLAVEISQQLENFMTPPQWLRMCWKYSWNSRPMDIFVQLLLPVLLAWVAACAALILWKVTPIRTEYKTLTLPVGILAVIWAFFKIFLQVVQPVTEKIMGYIALPDHRSMLGYQQQVIGDINFLKDQLCEEAHFPWTILGFLGQLFMSNSYYMEDTSVRKQSPRLHNLRIVVFIDDLDRCDEKTVLELLRAINLILGSCGISVVVGVDKGMVQRAITKEFLKDTGNKLLDIVKNDQKVVQEHKISYTHDLADKYLQKIIQLPIQMPDPSRENLKHFLEGQIGRRSGGLQNDILEKVKNKEDAEEKLEENEEDDEEQLEEDEEGDEEEQLEEDEEGDDEEQLEMDEEGDDDEQLEKDEEDEEEEADNPKTSKGNVDSQDILLQISPTYSEAVSLPTKSQGASRHIAFHLLLANYSPMERDLLIKLCDSVIEDRKFPREWKRFLNYHRLAWSILSQDPSMEKKALKGWQRKLILWIFVCWNWKEQMDVIIENWQDILSKTSKGQEDMHWQEKNDVASLSLGDVIGVYMESNTWKTKEEINHIRHRKRDRQEEKWIDLYNTLKEEYDLRLQFIEIFQQFRFYCKLNHLEIGEKYMGRNK